MSEPQRCDSCGTTSAGGAWIQQGVGGGQRPITRCGACHGQHTASQAVATSYRSSGPWTRSVSDQAHMDDEDRRARVQARHPEWEEREAAAGVESSPDAHAWYGGRGSLAHPSLHAAASELKTKLAHEAAEAESPGSMARKMLEQRASQDAEMGAWKDIFKDRRR